MTVFCAVFVGTRKPQCKVEGLQLLLHGDVFLAGKTLAQHLQMTLVGEAAVPLLHEHQRLQVREGDVLDVAVDEGHLRDRQRRCAYL